ncbi:tetratricopeptide repeat protein [Erythrobacter sp. NE805]|uniref:tetratricopeptide repeat protein n=1 Tax=Erythrobacter sp. NE805 TaxID=3389875 RepID=UPI00396B1278
MTCRPRRIAALALLLGVAGCAGGGEGGAGADRAGANPAQAKLIAEADAAMTRGALADAGRTLDAARSLDPENPDLWLAIARLRLRGGEHLTALEAADRALALGPDHGPALLLRAMLVRDAHGAAAARHWFERAAEADPDNPDIWAEYAATLGDAGEAKAMLAAVRRLAALAPEDPRVFYLQAVLAARGGEDVLARSLLAKSGMAAKGVPAAMLLDAVISLRQGNAESAVASLESLAARQPANVRVRELLAHALLAGNHPDLVVTRFGADATRAEASPYLVMLVARAQEQLGDRAAAAPLLARANRALRDAPTVLAVREGLPEPTAAVRAAIQAGDRAGARARGAALRERFPASSDVASLAGDALLGAGDLAGALAAYARASEARRPWPLARKAAWAHARAGDAAAADLLLAEQVAGEPDTASAVIALASRQAARGDWARAALLLDHAVALGAGHDPALLALRVRAARTLGKGQEADRFAQILAEVQPRRLAAP